MDCYKTKNSDKIYKISVENFERDPGLYKPYYKDGACYALCPVCDNPIRLCALYNQNDNSPKPYGRHTGKDIDKLAPFNYQKYDYCPYASHRKGNNNYDEMIKDGVDNSTIEALKLLRDHFDKVIYLLKKESGIIIKKTLAEKMLKSFLGNGNENAGYLFYYFNKTNFPFVFANRCQDFPIRGQFISQQSDLYTALVQNGIVFSDKGQIICDYEVNPDFYLFSFIHYNIETINGDTHETVKFCVFDNQRNIIFERKIIIDLVYINNLINMENFKRNEELLEIARTLINYRLEQLQK